jgi:transposase
MALAKQHPDWVVGFEDEVWFSRLAQPKLHTWSETGPLRLHTKAKDKAQPSAMACYGLLIAGSGQPHSDQRMLRFVRGRPVSCVTVQFLDWATQTLAERGIGVLVLVWDNASWHRSREVKEWLQAHKRKLKSQNTQGETRGCRVLVCPLPVKSPWLNPIEVRWVHGKRNTLEPKRKLEPQELQHRLCRYYKCPLLPPI